jgi:hypothetical protein
MTQGNPIFLGSAEIGVFGKERDYRGIEIAEPTTVEGDADQQCDDALGDGRDVVRPLPSLIGSTPLGWMAEVNGLLVDLRTMPREVQEVAFAKGIIPYIPADGQDRS